LTIIYIKLFFGQIFHNWAGVVSLKDIRHFFRWRRSQNVGATPVADGQPWITFDAIQYLEDTVQPSHRIFEFGGGGSTLFFLKRCHEVITVEHDAKWFLLLEQLVETKQLPNWVGQLVEPEQGDLVNSPSSDNPEHYSSGSTKDVNYKKYASLIDSYPDEYFDIILVDGRSRPACIKHAAPKLRKGGLMVLDNADRIYYLGTTVLKTLSEYSLVLATKGPSPYCTLFTQTNIWKKTG
jgi:hypothetical protein